MLEVYSCHFYFVSIFLDVIHVSCLNDIQANNQIKDFKKKKNLGKINAEHVHIGDY